MAFPKPAGTINLSIRTYSGLHPSNLKFLVETGFPQFPCGEAGGILKAYKTILILTVFPSGLINIFLIGFIQKLSLKS